MRVGDNKKELFNLISDTIPSIQSNTLLIATKNEHVVSNKDINSSRLEMCNHEEADSRMFVHLYDAPINGSKKFKVVTIFYQSQSCGLSMEQEEIDVGILYIYMLIYLAKKSVEHCCFGIHLPAAAQSPCLPVKEKEHVGTYGNVFQQSLAHL